MPGKHLASNGKRAPEGGRFLSEDPIGVAGGLNQYAFAENDPINGRDPSGLWACYDTHYVERNVNTGMIVNEWDEWDYCVPEPGDFASGSSHGNTQVVQQQKPKPRTPTCGSDGYRDATEGERNTILTNARNQIGVRYFLNGGAKSSPSAGFDCSGLVSYCINTAGIAFVYQATRAMSSTSNKSLRRLSAGEAVQPGDLMLFPGHVGFYDPGQSKKGDFLSATSSKGVRYENPKYWAGGKYTPLRIRTKCN